METIEIAFDGVQVYRPTEITADLRNISEILFHPMRMVGYWDVPSQDHLCPQAKLGAPCPHARRDDDPERVDYLTTVERDLDGVLDVYFPHAEVHIFLS